MADFQFTKRYEGLAWHLENKVSVMGPGGGRHFFTKAIWDTGATNSMISDTVVRELGLVPIGARFVTGFHGKERLKTFEVGLTLERGFFLGRFTVTSATEFTEDHHVLLGMGIITKLDFLISNVGEITVLSIRYPSSQTIDFEDPTSL